MSKFKTGDAVKIRAGIKNEDMGTTNPRLDLDMVYHIDYIENDGTIRLRECATYIFSPEWIRLADKVVARIKALGIKNVLFNNPATIVFWTDGTKTVVKLRKGDKWDPEKGLAMACAKKLLGNRDGYHKALKKLYTTGGNWKKDMSTEAIRAAVSTGCIRNDCENCPCCPDRGGKCYIIAFAYRDQLITMLEAFEKADKWSYDDWRLSHA